MYDSAWGGAESALRSITPRPYRISNLLKCHMKVPIIWHKVTKNHRHKFYDQNVILDFRRGERILLPPCKIGLRLWLVWEISRSNCFFASKDWNADKGLIDPIAFANKSLSLSILVFKGFHNGLFKDASKIHPQNVTN